jgi:hypothetical protein
MLTKVAALSMAALMTVTGLPVAGLDGALTTVEAANVFGIQIAGKDSGNTHTMRVGQVKAISLVSGSNATTGSAAVSDTTVARMVAEDGTTGATVDFLTTASKGYIEALTTGSAVVSAGYKTAGNPTGSEADTLKLVVEEASLKTDIVKDVTFTVDYGNSTEEITVPYKKMMDGSFTKTLKYVNPAAKINVASITYGDAKMVANVGTDYDVCVNGIDPVANNATANAIGAVGTYKIYLVGKGLLKDSVVFSLTVGTTALTSSNTKIKTLAPLTWSVKNEYDPADLNGLLEIDANGDGNPDQSLNAADCKLTYSGNVGVTDTAQLKIEPKSTTGYTGTFTQKFSIIKADMSTFDVRVVGTNTTKLDNQAYTGSAIEPKGFELYIDGVAGEVPYDDSRYANAYEKDNESEYAKNSDGIKDDTETYKVRHLKLASSDWKIVSYASNTNKGDATITVTGSDNNNGKFLNTAAGAVNLGFKIVGDDNDISKSAKVSMELEVDGEKVAIKNGGSTVYTGEARRPEVTVTFTDKDKKETDLGSGDVDVTYLDNTDVGTATVKIKGIGNYCGSLTQTFNITPKDINKSDDVTIDSIGSITYNGTAKTPKVEGARDSESGKALTQGKDYTVYYDNNINAGEKATITLQGNKNYTGKKVFYFTIDPATLSSVKIDDVENQVYTGSEITPDITAKFTLGDGTSYTLVKDVDYTLTYNDNVGNADSTTGSQGTVTITAKNNFTGTDSKQFNIVPAANDLANAVIELERPEVEYDGEYHVAVVKSVKMGETVLANNEYEVVAPVSEKEAGEYTLQIRGTTNGANIYGGVGEATFTITPKAATVDFKLSATKKTYNGKAQTVKVTNVTRDGVEITEDDYTVSGATKATDAGKNTVTVTLKGNYSGSAKKTWTIAKAKQTIKVSPASKTFKAKKVAKKAQSFTIKVTGAKGTKTFKSSSKKVTVSKAGKVTVKKGTKKGTYKITVSAKATKNYNAAASKTVKVVVK